MTQQQADYLRLPLLDGAFGVAQIFEVDDTRSGSLFLGLSDRKVDATQDIAPFRLAEVIGMAFTDESLITSGQWTIAGFDQIPKFRTVFDYDAAKRAQFPDHPVHDPSVIEAFVNAVHGLYPWDSFGPLFDSIKRADVERPSAAIMGGT